MAVITKISESTRPPGRRVIFVDGHKTLVCRAGTVRRAGLREGDEWTEELAARIESAEGQSKCLESAGRFLARRAHGRRELEMKLRRRWAGEVVRVVLDELAGHGYLNDAQFATEKAESALRLKGHGPRRTRLELARAGVTGAVADRAIAEVYEGVDSVELAKKLARKHAGRLRGLDPQVARRRLAGLLQRRGFDFESTRAAMDEVLGAVE